MTFSCTCTRILFMAWKVTCLSWYHSDSCMQNAVEIALFVTLIHRVNTCLHVLMSINCCCFFVVASRYVCSSVVTADDIPSCYDGRRFFLVAYSTVRRLSTYVRLTYHFVCSYCYVLRYFPQVIQQSCDACCCVIMLLCEYSEMLSMCAIFAHIMPNLVQKVLHPNAAHSKITKTIDYFPNLFRYANHIHKLVWFWYLLGYMTKKPKAYDFP